LKRDLPVELDVSPCPGEESPTAASLVLGVAVEKVLVGKRLKERTLRHYVSPEIYLNK
jgi:hypothetical protein